jgi:hypothetical protein
VDPSYFPEGTAEQTLPTIAASYTKNFNNGHMVLGGAYNTFDVNAWHDTHTIDCYVVGLGGQVHFGAFTFSGIVMAGQNPGNILNVDTDSNDTRGIGGYASVYEEDNEDVWSDTEVVGLNLIGAYKINDMFCMEAGYGYIKADFDIRGMDDDEACSYYFQVPVTLAAGVIITPEIGVLNYEEDYQSDITYFGVKWEINF